jgi:signal transduction histidine kinase
VTDLLPPAAPSIPEREQHRRRRLRQEITLRATVAVLILAFDRIFTVTTGRTGLPALSFLALGSLFLNVLYWLLGRSGQWGRVQAYVRMLVDIGFITAGLGIAGGLAAAPYLGVYMIVPAYVGLVLSRPAALVTTAIAPLAYLAMVGLQQTGWLPAAPPSLVNDWTIVAFNLLMLAVIGVLVAQFGEAYRRSRRRLAALNRELERATDESMRLNAEIQRAAQLSVLGEVVAGVTHELGNVLTAALGHIALARRKVAVERPDVDEHLEQIEQSFDAASRIVKSTLETARQPRTSVDRVSLAEVARRIADLKAYDLRRDGIHVRLRFPAAFPPVLAAPFQLQQVLLNLVTNAQQALREVPPPRIIEITGTPEGDRAVLEVRDTGPGIPADALGRVFEPFFTTKPSGTGLGLAISAVIARDLGGELTVASGAGRGAVFRLTLPVHRRDGEAART